MSRFILSAASYSIHNFWLWMSEHEKRAGTRTAQFHNTHTYVATKRSVAACAVSSGPGPVIVDAPSVNRASLNTLVEIIKWMSYIWLVWLSWLIGRFFSQRAVCWLVARASNIALRDIGEVQHG